MPSFVKDPNSVLDYEWDWTAWLDGDTISSVEFTVPDGLTKDSSSNTTTAATVWLSGGTARVNYEVTCRVVTAGGRTDDRTVTIRCYDR